MRINFATTQDARFWRALERTREALAGRAGARPVAMSQR